jgi:RNA polymerase sigma-70 factor (ECF subfamily)
VPIVRPGEHWLIWRLKKGDREAARELIRIHHGAVFGYLRRLGADAAQAEDLTQETYTKAWSSIAGLRREASLRAWLLTIARNQYLQLVRRRRGDESPMDDAPEPADPAPAADGTLAGQQRDERLHGEVDRLEPALRETVALHYFQELSLREVAAVLGVPAGTVKSRLARALDALRRALEQQEANHERPATGQATADTL